MNIEPDLQGRILTIHLRYTNLWWATTLNAEEIKFRMNLVFFLSLTFVCGIDNTESAFENEKAGTLNENVSNWKETNESAEEAEALTRLEIELEELLQTHIAVEIQQERYQEFEQQEHQQQQHGMRLRR